MIWRILRCFLFLLPAETAHQVGGLGLITLNFFFRDHSGSPRKNSLKSRFFFGKRLVSPVGMAAGFDKDAKYIPALAALGFGFVEIGTVTPEPQPGNPRPRLFRLPHSSALVNRLGFNSEGAEAVRARLNRLRGRRQLGIPVGINIGKNRHTPLEKAGEDYLRAQEILFPVADFFVVNLSSPNTPGLRQLLDESHLAPLVSGLQKQNRELAKKISGGTRPLLLKISPDMDMADRKRAVELAMAADFAGIIATNTTIRRDLAGIDPRDAGVAEEQGGLSGLPIRELAASHVAEIRNWMGTEKILVSVGGIFDAAEASRRLDAGADLIEIYTSFIYNGPRFPAELTKALTDGK